jgi:phenylpropionate dioxygenase-like ring-hydroxylating dioxygenase large terminal subunit
MSEQTSDAELPRAREDRCPGLSYSEMLAGDTRPVPDCLIAESNQELGDQPLDPARYTSDAFAAAERETLWPNIWQFVAREEDLPEPGDTVVYEIADKNYLLVRQSDGSIKAFHNVCLHRGRLLRDEGGRSVNLRCPFHGFTWHNDGTLKEIPCRWDFPHLEGKDLSLPELRVERWQGFVMVTENHELPPFREWVGPGVKHYDLWKLDECHTVAWIGRVFPANWKATTEAFMEAFHSVVTHPQILGFTADANTRYDLYGDHMNRAITPNGALSPHVRGRGQRYVLDTIADFLGEDGGVRFATGADLGDFAPDDPLLARKVLAAANREAFQAMDGRDYAQASDSEVLDNFTYNIFPNFAPWGGLVPNIVYRWRPWGDVDHCLMEVRILTRTAVGTTPPKAPQMHLIGQDESFTTVAHLIGAGLAGVFDQDLANLASVQKGMKASANGRIELGHYQESRIRHFHHTLDKYLSGDLPGKSITA